MPATPTKKMRFKLNIIVLGFLALAFLFIVGRIIYIACFAEVDGVKYGVKAYNQQLGSDVVNANRGTIYDRNMVPLAQSATVWTVSVAPNQIDSDEKRELIAKGLSDILGLDYNEVLAKTQKNTKYELVKKKVEKPQADQITQYEKDNKLQGIHMVEDTKRYYPMTTAASHTIGFTGTDNQGLLGIELQYDSILSGTKGKVTIAQNALGTSLPFEYEYYHPAKDGNSIVLSIDSTIQNYLDKALKEAAALRKPANRCLAMMMDVNTGEILGLSVQPDFDLNDPYTITDANLLAGLQGKQGDDLTQATSEARQSMWKNKAVSETYEPGSVFKVVTASGALEEKTQSLESQYYCTGSTQVEDRTFHCWKAGGHGAEDFTQAVVNSCNPAFIQIGQSLGFDLFYRYFESYGLTQKTGIDLPGESDSIYVHKGDFNLVSLASESFGQTMSITPIQMISTFCASVNGGNLVTPHVVKQVVDQNGDIVKSYGTDVKRQVISEETSKQMQYVLQQVVEGSNAAVPGYRIAGKSGTAQKLGRLPERVYVASFVGAVPADKPQYALMVLVDEPTDGTYYGGVICGPIFAQIMREAIPYLGISPEYTEEELKTLTIPMPAVQSMSAEEAKKKLESSGITNVQIMGSGDVVLQQVPAAGSSVSSSAMVILYMDKEAMVTTTVPNVLNMSQAQANSVLTKAGLNLVMSNSNVRNQKAKAVAQSPSAGSVVPKGTAITVQFLTNDETG